MRGDVFQLVLSRRFEQKFKGDEFNVYRALRNINPSPYLFFFDYGNYKLFGSSPESQLIIKDNKAIIHPIAGTFKRTGDFETDLQSAESLKKILRKMQNIPCSLTWREMISESWEKCDRNKAQGNTVIFTCYSYGK